MIVIMIKMSKIVANLGEILFLFPKKEKWLELETSCVTSFRTWFIFSKHLLSGILCLVAMTPAATSQKNFP